MSLGGSRLSVALASVAGLRSVLVEGRRAVLRIERDPGFAMVELALGPSHRGPEAGELAMTVRAEGLDGDALAAELLASLELARPDDGPGLDVEAVQSGAWSALRRVHQAPATGVARDRARLEAAGLVLRAIPRGDDVVLVAARDAEAADRLADAERHGALAAIAAALGAPPCCAQALVPDRLEAAERAWVEAPDWRLNPFHGDVLAPVVPCRLDCAAASKVAAAALGDRAAALRPRLARGLVAGRSALAFAQRREGRLEDVVAIVGDAGAWVHAPVDAHGRTDAEGRYFHFGEGAGDGGP
ncbi:MAG: hypothetical protein AAF447_27485 [Myxococcota bacterium]